MQPIIDTFHKKLHSSWLSVKFPEEIESEIIMINFSDIDKCKKALNEKGIPFKILNPDNIATNINPNKVHRYTKPTEFGKEEARKYILDSIEQLKEDYRNELNDSGSDITCSQSYSERIEELENVLKSEKDTKLIITNFHREANLYYQIQITFNKPNSEEIDRRIYHISPHRKNILIVDKKRNSNKVDPLKLLKGFKRIHMPRNKNDIYIKSTNPNSEMKKIG